MTLLRAHTLPINFQAILRVDFGPGIAIDTYNDSLAGVDSTLGAQRT